jgi:hypothetical protein
MRSLVRTTVVAACAVLCASAVTAQTVQVGKDMSLTFKGFISATAFAQDQNFAFGNGQNAEWPIPPNTTVDEWFGGGDVRNTRLTMVFDGPKVVGDWKVGGTIEMDFFGGFNGIGAFSGQQPDPRLRLGFMDFGNGSTTIRIGQQWAPLFGNVAVSLSHIAFPLGYGSAGDIGWRFPGIFLYQKLTGKDAAVNADLVFAVQSGSWNCNYPFTTPPETTNPNVCGNNNIDFQSAGNATWPQFEARFNLGGKMGDKSTWSTYIVGHIDQKDLSGAGRSLPNDKLTGSAVEIGAKFQIGPVMIQGNGYTGHAIGHQFGMLSQFGKIQSTGGWGQIGFDFTRNWSLFGFWGIEDPKDSDVFNSANNRLKNEMYVGMLRWKAGPYALGFEFLYDKLTTGVRTPAGLVIETKTTGRQIALSGLYNF